jgi:hypothetical protein
VDAAAVALLRLKGSLHLDRGSVPKAGRAAATRPHSGAGKALYPRCHFIGAPVALRRLGYVARMARRKQPASLQSTTTHHRLSSIEAVNAFFTSCGSL